MNFRGTQWDSPWELLPPRPPIFIQRPGSFISLEEFADGTRQEPSGVRTGLGKGLRLSPGCHPGLSIIGAPVPCVAVSGPRCPGAEAAVRSLGLWVYSRTADHR